MQFCCAVSYCGYIDELVQERHNCSVLAMEECLSCINTSISTIGDAWGIFTALIFQEYNCIITLVPVKQPWVHGWNWWVANHNKYNTKHSRWHHSQVIWIRSLRCVCLVNWFCYQLIAKPGNKTDTLPWPDPLYCTQIKIHMVMINYTACNINACQINIIDMVIEYQLQKWYKSKSNRSGCGSGKTLEVGNVSIQCYLSWKSTVKFSRPWYVDQNQQWKLAWKPPLRTRHDGQHFPDNIFQSIFLYFHWNLFPGVQLRINQNCFRWWLDTKKARSHSRNQW